MAKSILVSDVTDVEAPVNVALKPGNVTSFSAGVLVAASTGSNPNAIYVLGMNPSNGDGVDEAYTANDTALAHRLEPGKVRNVRVANGTYAMGATLAVATGGTLTGSNSNVVATANEAKTTTNADPFLSVVGV